MTAYLLTWNPKKSKWCELKKDISRFRAGGAIKLQWSCGNTKRIAKGDRLYLLRQGVEPRGVMASGIALGAPTEDRSWDSAEKTARYVPVALDALLDPAADGVLPLSELRDGPLGGVNWRTQVSGIVINDAAAEILNKRWRKFVAMVTHAPLPLPEEVSAQTEYYEGAVNRITVNAYERDKAARQACIDYHGLQCAACDFDFEAVYGERGAGFIHVHHQVPLSEVNARYKVNPRKDLVPVCPNCHAMIHRSGKVLTVRQLRAFLMNQRKRLK